MTNIQIIASEAIAHNLYTEEQVEELFSTVGCLPLFTFAEWKKAGYFVKKGQKAKLTCYIWKMKKEKEQSKDKDGNDVEVDATNFYKVKAFLFDETQVEKMAQVEKVGA